jgi:Ca2+/H+ antiporter
VARKQSAPPTTGAALIAQARGRNRLLALCVAVFMAAVFALTIVLTVASHREELAQHRDASAHTAAR